MIQKLFGVITRKFQRLWNADGMDNMKKVENVFVVVVYRNTVDIIDFLKSVSNLMDDYKVIIINNYYDDESKKQFQEIAFKNNCDFINCENKGYGAGNNTGILFAINNYDFDFLTISNPDIVLESFPTNIFSTMADGVIGGDIRNLSGKKQNPMVAVNSTWGTRMLYEGLKYNSSFKLIIGKGINKITRDFCLLHHQAWALPYQKVYQIHGCFLTLSRKVIDQIGAPYDEKMFLFGEEGYLAFLLNKRKIPTYYCPAIKALHKEDGSMKFRNNISEECIKASIYFFEKYYFRTGDN